LPGGGFDINRDVQSRQLSRGMRVASFLGALALSAILILLLLVLVLVLVLVLRRLRGRAVPA